ncbi:MAG: phage virion morphogenesis protein [Myxococcales bacterium]|nr:phage virion morphogenesis protein [Myxococcales bacterium]
MSGVVVNLAGLLPARRRLLALVSPTNLGQLREVVASEGESQIRRRISDEKTDPEGKAWPEWSPEYAAERAAKGGLLELEGHLRDSIAYEINGDTILVGSNLVYAGVHNEGDDDMGIPERRYLGFSAENLDDIGEVIVDFWGRVLG